MRTTARSTSGVSAITSAGFAVVAPLLLLALVLPSLTGVGCTSGRASNADNNDATIADLLRSGSRDRDARVQPAAPGEAMLSDAASLPTPRAAHAAAYADGYIYCVGGMSTGPRGAWNDRKAWRYQIAEDAWQFMAEPQHARDFPAAAAFNGHVFLVGGMHRATASPDSPEVYPRHVERYDIAADQWWLAGEMPAPRARFGSVQIGSELWIVGGYTQAEGNFARVDVLDLSTETWRRAPDLPVAIHGCAVAAYHDDIIVLGNQRNGERAWILRRDDRESGHAWVPLPDAPETRLFAVGIETDLPQTAGSAGARPAMFVFGNRAHGPVPVLGWVRDDQGAWSWRLAANAMLNTHRAPAVRVDGIVYCVGGETVDGSTARVQRLRLDAIRWR